MDKSKILFDGTCIVCDYEIAHYKKMAPEIFEIIDISSSDFSAAQYGLTPEAVQHHMHVLTPDGRVVKGVDAFTHVWSQLPRYRWAEKLIHLPGIYGLAKVGYEIFAKNRHWLPKRRR